MCNRDEVTYLISELVIFGPDGHCIVSPITVCQGSTDANEFLRQEELAIHEVYSYTDYTYAFNVVIDCPDHGQSEVVL